MSDTARLDAALDRIRGAVILTFDRTDASVYANWRAKPEYVEAIRQAEPDERPIEYSPAGVWDDDLG